MPKPVTNADLVRTACWVSKHAASWAGDTIAMMGNNSPLGNAEVELETIERFRADIIKLLDLLSR